VKHVFLTEQQKLTAQLSTRVVALLLIAGPLMFGAVLKLQTGVPADTLFGAWVHSSGFAVALVILGFAGQWGFPVVAGVLAGDLFSSEDRYGTWKMVLTRSQGRRDLFAGKVLAAAVFVTGLLVLATAASLIAGLIFTGGQSLVGLSGKLISPGAAVGLVIAAWAVSLLPLLAFTSLAVLFSVATRNGIIGVLGPVLLGVVMQLLALIGTGSWVHTLLVGSAFDDWHGLLSSHRFYGQLIEGSVVSVAWIVVSLACAWAILRRRDFAGAPVARRPGWIPAIRAVAVACAIVAILGVASNWGPAAITAARLQRSFAATFNELTLLQQRLLHRRVPPGAKLNILPNCRRRAGASRGPGDDWVCGLDVLIQQPGSNPFNPTLVSYDMSVKSNGCYKADAPPSFIGRQLMQVGPRRYVVNPLFTIYGCFDTT
jgi:ABC-2 type transport system permease protein